MAVWDLLVGVVVPFIGVLTVVVFVHEYGHFWVARRCGVRVEAFSIGFGAELFHWRDRHGTRWRIGALPLGGYVKFLGDENAASVPDRSAGAKLTAAERQGSFHNKPLIARAAVVVAGPFANFLLSILVLAGIHMAVGRVVAPPVVQEVIADGAAAAAGVQQGDRILSMNGTKIDEFGDLQRFVFRNGASPITTVIERGGERVVVDVTPRMVAMDDGTGHMVERPLLGVRGGGPEISVGHRAGPLEALSLGVKDTWFIVDSSIAFIGRMISGDGGSDELGGPIRIAQVSGQAADLGFVALLNLVALLSASIGFINLLPIPMLDGGHLMFYAYEAVRGKPLGERAQEMSFRFGLAVVLGLMVFATWNDLARLRVFDFLSAL